MVNIQDRAIIAPIAPMPPLRANDVMHHGKRKANAVFTPNASARPPKRGTYRRHSNELKRAVVAQSLLPNAWVSRIDRQYNFSANQVFAWRKLFGNQQRKPGNTVSVWALLQVTAAAPAMEQPVTEQAPASASVIELTVGEAQSTRTCCSGYC